MCRLLTLLPEFIIKLLYRGVVRISATDVLMVSLFNIIWMHVFFFSLCVTDLRWNSIGILGSRALLSSLKHNNTILHIHLDGNSIPVDILDAFGKILAVFQDKIQARKAGGFEGVRVNSPFDLQKIISIPQNCTF